MQTQVSLIVINDAGESNRAVCLGEKLSCNNSWSYLNYQENNLWGKMVEDDLKWNTTLD